MLYLLPPWSTLAVAVLTALDNSGKEWLQIFLSVSAVLQGVGDTVEQEASVDPYIKPLKHTLTCANTISKNRIHNTVDLFGLRLFLLKLKTETENTVAK